MMTYLDEIKWKHPWRYRKAWWSLRIKLWARTVMRRIVFALGCIFLVLVCALTLCLIPVARMSQLADWMGKQATKVWPEWGREELPKPWENEV